MPHATANYPSMSFPRDASKSRDRVLYQTLDLPVAGNMLYSTAMIPGALKPLIAKHCSIFKLKIKDIHQYLSMHSIHLYTQIDKMLWRGKRCINLGIIYFLYFSTHWLNEKKCIAINGIGLDLCGCSRLDLIHNYCPQLQKQCVFQCSFYMQRYSVEWEVFKYLPKVRIA